MLMKVHSKKERYKPWRQHEPSYHTDGNNLHFVSAWCLVTLNLKPQDKYHSLHIHREENEKQGIKTIHLTWHKGLEAEADRNKVDTWTLELVQFLFCWEIIWTQQITHNPIIKTAKIIRTSPTDCMTISPDQ